MAASDNPKSTFASLLDNISPGITLGFSIGTGFGLAMMAWGYLRSPVQHRHKHMHEIPSTTQQTLKGIIKSMPTEFKVDHEIPSATQQSLKGIIKSIPTEFKVDLSNPKQETTKNSFSIASLLAKNDSSKPTIKGVPFPCTRITEAFEYCVKAEYHVGSSKCNIYSDLIKECAKIGA